MLNCYVKFQQSAIGTMNFDMTRHCLEDFRMETSWTNPQITRQIYNLSCVFGIILPSKVDRYENGSMGYAFYAAEGKFSQGHHKDQQEDEQYVP
ncbi:hypothetical protein HPG69_000540 [Diceros bicornis minor]|uniref:Uncharacterized protein n=1 Tax=Diceros bicornis minor TaxID=77932 RepID=A0A7J7FJ01_DICBM|nr:hypothetical protein HPG69_000540 [Diceros bicornis minor]